MTAEDDLMMSRKLWDAAISDPLDKEAMIRLGLLMYRMHMRTTYFKEDRFNELVIRGLADMLLRAFSTIGVDVLSEMKKDLSQDGDYFEPGMWESPMYTVLSHLWLEERIGMGEPLTLLELLMIGHDLEYYVRPNILRILWTAKVSYGHSSLLYSTSQLKKDGEQGSLAYGMKGMRDWLESDASYYLDQVEKRELNRLFNLLGSDDGLQLPFDELRNWIAHRDFMLVDDGVILNFHPHASSLRMHATRAQVTDLRQTILGLLALLRGFNSMFLAHVVSKVGDISPKPVQSKSRMA